MSKSLLVPNSAYLLATLCVLMLFSCNSGPAEVPKPRAYPRVEYPDRNTVAFESEDCPFSFEYPDYFDIEPKRSFFGESPANACWFDLYSKELNARIHCSYYPVNDQNSFADLVNDAFTLANKINQRSNFMDEIKVANANGIGGLVMEFHGPAASPMHFYLSDTSQHFLKASLYYRTEARPDSLAPITEFIKTDIAGIINSFVWNE